MYTHTHTHHMHTVCVSTCSGQKIASDSDSLEPELQLVVRRHVGARNGTWVLGKNKCCPIEPSFQTVAVYSLSVNLIQM